MELRLSGLFALFAFALGAAVGSFVNVVAYRLPRELSVAVPSSFCPHCERKIPFWLNIPILSYVGLRGRCLMCGGAIPFRYFLTELTLAVAALYLYLSFPPFDAASRFVLIAALFAASLIDYDWRIIPDVISVSGIPLGILAATFAMPEIGWRQSLIGLLVGGVFLFAVGEAYRLIRGKEGMGMGDVKLLAMIGAFLGWPAVLFTIFAGSMLGSIGGLALALSGRRTPPALGSEEISASLGERSGNAQDTEKVSVLQTTIPFGPFLSIAAAIFALFQPQLTNWYLAH